VFAFREEQSDEMKSEVGGEHLRRFTWRRVVSKKKKYFYLTGARRKS
jgi:hypothetical protein